MLLILALALAPTPDIIHPPAPTLSPCSSYLHCLHASTPASIPLAAPAVASFHAAGAKGSETLYKV